MVTKTLVEQKDPVLFLVSIYNADGTETERLIRANSAHAARSHVMHACKANADNVADVLGKGGKIEQAAE